MMAKTPQFATDQEESEFWDTHDSTDYLDDTTEVDVTFVDARPRKEQISLRLDRETITRLKTLARRRGIGYQTLIRMWVMERLNQEAG
jgi:predicted DNA binding CopG/RHH family protein